MLALLLSVCVRNWVIDRLKNGRQVHLLAAGMSRSASTWQFNALRILIEHATASEGLKVQVHSAHGHRMVDIEGCLSRRVCVVKMHEFVPALLSKIDAVFLTHRDPRDVLMSSAGKINACLNDGKQPVAVAFMSYAAWLPFACFDMQYESFMATGADTQITELADRLGIPYATRTPPSSIFSFFLPYAGLHLTSQSATAGVSIVSIARAIRKDSHNPKLNTKRQEKTGFMTGHVTKVTTEPGAYKRFNNKLMQQHVSGRCNIKKELRLIELGWGGWMRRHNYSCDSKENLFVDQLAERSWLMMEDDEQYGGNRCPYQTLLHQALQNR